MLGGTMSCYPVCNFVVREQNTVTVLAVILELSLDYLARASW